MKKKKTIYDESYRKLISQLIDIRKQKKITQEDLSKETGLPRTDISKVETFVRRLDVIELNKWLHGLDIKIDILIEIEKILEQSSK